MARQSILVTVIELSHRLRSAIFQTCHVSCKVAVHTLLKRIHLAVACEQAKAALRKQVEDDEQLLTSTEAMMQQLQASLAAARQDVVVHQDALASSQSTADALQSKLKVAQQEMQAQQATSIQSSQDLQTEVDQVRQQLQKARDCVSTAEASVAAKEAQTLGLEAALQSEHSDEVRRCAIRHGRALD